MNSIIQNKYLVEDFFVSKVCKSGSNWKTKATKKISFRIFKTHYKMRRLEMCWTVNHLALPDWEICDQIAMVVLPSELWENKFRLVQNVWIFLPEEWGNLFIKGYQDVLNGKLDLQSNDNSSFALLLITQSVKVWFKNLFYCLIFRVEWNHFFSSKSH